MAKLRVKESQITTREQRLKFMSLFSKSALEQATHKMGLKRIGPQQKIQDITDKLESPDTDDAEAEKLLDEFHELSDGLVPNMDKDIEVEVAVSDGRISNSSNFQKRFMEIFDDEKKLMDILGVPEPYQQTGKKNYFEIQDAEPYTTHSMESTESVRKRAREHEQE